MGKMHQPEVWQSRLPELKHRPSFDRLEATDDQTASESRLQPDYENFPMDAPYATPHQVRQAYKAGLEAARLLCMDEIVDLRLQLAQREPKELANVHRIYLDSD